VAGPVVAKPVRFARVSPGLVGTPPDVPEAYPRWAAHDRPDHGAVGRSVLGQPAGCVERTRLTEAVNCPQLLAGPVGAAQLGSQALNLPGEPARAAWPL
jgi:hypothetical protein